MFDPGWEGTLLEPTHFGRCSRVTVFQSMRSQNRPPGPQQLCHHRLTAVSSRNQQPATRKARSSLWLMAAVTLALELMLLRLASLGGASSTDDYDPATSRVFFASIHPSRQS